MSEFDPLPPHSPTCMGCRPENPSGLQMSVFQCNTTSVFTDLTFDQRQVGAPGLAHGGALAAACDDLFGFLLYAAKVPAVTRTLSVEYLAPVPLNAPHRIIASIKERDGRKLHVSAQAEGVDGEVKFTAKALFIIVPRSHFERFGDFKDHPALDRLAIANAATDGAITAEERL